MAFVKQNITMTGKGLVKNEARIMYDPMLQRNFVWKDNQQSNLIRAIILDYPIPAIYARDIGDSNYWILDGRQRITTVQRFIKNEFALSKTLESIGDVEVAGKYFKELPEDFQDEILTRNFLIYSMRNMTDAEVSQMFIYLNSNSKMEKMELLRVMASREVMELIVTMENQPMFKSLKLSKNQFNHFMNEEVIIHTLAVVMNGAYDLGTDSYTKFTMSLAEGIPQEIKDIMLNTTVYLDEVFSMPDNFMKKVHVPIIFKTAIQAQEDRIPASKFGGWVQDFFKRRTEGDPYTGAARVSSAEKHSVQTRLTEMMKDYQKNIKDAKDYIQPKVKPATTSTGRGRKKKDAETTNTDNSNNKDLHGKITDMLNEYKTA